MSEDQRVRITKQTVFNRDESGARLFGWTLREMGTVAGTGVVALLFVPLWPFKFGVVVLTWLWVKKLKIRFPEKYFSSMWAYQTRQDGYFHHAAQRDTEWRPPIKPPKSRRQHLSKRVLS